MSVYLSPFPPLSLPPLPLPLHAFTVFPGDSQVCLRRPVICILEMLAPSSSSASLCPSAPGALIFLSHFHVAPHFLFLCQSPPNFSHTHSEQLFPLVENISANHRRILLLLPSQTFPADFPGAFSLPPHLLCLLIWRQKNN